MPLLMVVVGYCFVVQGEPDRFLVFFPLLPSSLLSLSPSQVVKSNTVKERYIIAQYCSLSQVVYNIGRMAGRFVGIIRVGVASLEI